MNTPTERDRLFGGPFDGAARAEVHCFVFDNGKEIRIATDANRLVRYLHNGKRYVFAGWLVR